MNILQQKPLFEMHISAQDQRFFLNVNGCHIYREFDFDGQLDTIIPVNEFMRSGENQISLTVLPMEVGGDFDPSANVSAELWVRSQGSAKDEGWCIGTIDFSGGDAEDDYRGTARSSASCRLNSEDGFIEDEQGDVIVKDIKFRDEALFAGAYTVLRDFDIPNSLPLWAFFNSDCLPDYNTFRNEDPVQFAKDSESLLVEYMKVQDALADGSEEAIQNILPMFAERNRELDQAYYMEPGSMEDQLRHSFLRECRDPDQELVELSSEYVDMIVEENLKLTALCRNGCESAIGFNDESCESSTDYEILFRRENGKWIISR